MSVTCPSCGRVYDFATLRLQGQDRMGTCGQCGHRFRIRLPVRPAGRGTAQMTMVGRPSAPAEERRAPHVRIALTVLSGSDTDQVFLLTRSVTVIGRTQGEIRVPDPRVSSRHAQVELPGGEVWLRDLGSTNGTFVNGERIDLRRLTHLDEVTVGSTRFLYTYIEDLASVYEASSPDA